MDLIIDQEIILTKFQTSDKSDIINYLNEKGIYENTLLIPFPYQEKDADWWISRNKEMNDLDKQFSWAIRKEGKLIGSISIKNLYGEGAHKDEIGYWLAKSFWGKGIMTKAIGGFCRHLMETTELVRVEAPVFAHNKASARVLEKNGFKLEGTLRKCYRKDGKIFDGLMYALVRE